MKKLTMKHTIFFLISSIILLSTCSRPIDFEVDEHERKIVLNGLIRSDNLLRINLSKSLSVLETNRIIEFIPNAVVQLYENGSFKEQMHYDTNGYYQANIHPTPEKTYMIVAEAEGLPTVRAITTLPKGIVMENLEFSYDSVYVNAELFDTISGEYYDTTFLSFDNAKLSFSIDDPEEQSNYYFFTITTLSKIYVYEPPDFNARYIGDDIISVGYENSFLNDHGNDLQINTIDGDVFSDESFNGQNKHFEIGLFNFGESVNRLFYIYLFSINKDLYEYSHDISEYDDTQGNPLVEPVQVITNIEGGYGFFSGCSVACDSIVLPYSEIPYAKTR